MTRPLLRTEALVDRLLAALTEGPCTTGELCARVGTVACSCQQGVKRWVAGIPVPCMACTTSAGWRPARTSDLTALLRRLERHGLVSGHRDQRVIWERLAPIVGLTEQETA